MQSVEMLLYHLPGRTGTASSITCLMHRALWCVGGGRGRGSSGRGKCLSAGAHVSRVRLERRWLWSKVCGASQAAVSSWNFALGTTEPLRDFKQGSKELRLTIQLNHFCFSVENRLQRGKSIRGGVVRSLLHSSRGKTTLPWARVDSKNFMTGYRW